MRTLLLILFSFFSLSFYSQDTIKRPKIGLVLSGGGAKGLAHIGVLKEIEKAGIKIDYIGGTSMGAIIGGLYACGYTASELDSIFNHLDSDALLKDYIPRGNKTFYEKRNDEVYAFTLPFQNLKLSAPKGLSKGMYNYSLLSGLTYNVRHIYDFNQLKIPFVCIATDIETGQERVFHNGLLPRVITASGAFPSLYTPVEIDGHLYIDGGVVNNYPVEEVKKMGADYIIGVDVQDGLKTRDQLKGVTNVLVQISNFDMVDRMKSKVAMTDLYIKPNINGFSVISFDEGAKIIQKGEEAAQEVAEQLHKLGTNFQTNILPNKTTDSLSIRAIGINGGKNYTRSYYLGKLRFQPNSRISYNDLNSGLNNLNATQNFSAINYQLVKNGEGDDLIVEVQENPVKTYIKFGLHYDDLFKSNALINVSKKNFAFKNDMLSFDFMLGDNFRYNFDYYIDNGFHWSFGVKSDFDQFRKESKVDYRNGALLTFLKRESIDIDIRNMANQIYIQTIFAQKFLVGTGFEHKYLTITSNSTAAFLPYIDKSTYFSALAFLKFDDMSSKYFPKSGWSFYGDFQHYFYSSDLSNDFNRVTILKADAAYVKTFFKKFAFKIQSEGGFSIGQNINGINDFVLGGYGFHKFQNFKSFLGYDFMDLHGDSYVKGSLSLDYEFIKKNYFNFTANYTNIGTKIFDQQKWLKAPTYSGYSFGYGVETLLGPIEIKHSWSPETSNHYTWFTVGFWF